MSAPAPDQRPTDGDHVDHTAMRQAMSAFPSGVTVLTTCAGTVPVGMTISSFASVSLNPPLLLQCVSRKAGCLPALLVGRAVAVNVLAHDQAFLARQFAGNREDRFAGTDFRPDDSGSPVLAGTAAWIGGVIDRIYDAGDHVILLILARTVHQTGKMPLLYHAGQMHDWTSAVA